MAEILKQTSDSIVPVITETSSISIAASLELFEGIIDNWKMEEGRISVEVTNIFARWQRRTLSRHSPSCRWPVFKGTYCTYTGSGTWCDRSYKRCLTLGNQDNFGGFRWLPSIIDKEIWWGKIPDNA